MISLLCVGKNKEKALRLLEDEYVKRLSSFTKIEVIEVKDEPNRHTDRLQEVDKIKEQEAKRVLAKIQERDWVVLLDLHGKMMDSVAFSRRLETWSQKASHLVFVIAGSLGPHESLVQRADFKLKLGDMTFTHLMTRILILEQIYRAYMIQNGRSYHK